MKIPTQDLLMPVAVITLAGSISFGLGEVAAAIRRYSSGSSEIGAWIMIAGAICFCWLLAIEVKRRRAAAASARDSKEDGSS